MNSSSTRGNGGEIETDGGGGGGQITSDAAASGIDEMGAVATSAVTIVVAPMAPEASGALTEEGPWTTPVVHAQHVSWHCSRTVSEEHRPRSLLLSHLVAAS